MKILFWPALLTVLICLSCSNNETARRMNYKMQAGKQNVNEQWLEMAPVTKGTSFLPQEFTITSDSIHYTITWDGLVSTPDRKTALPMEGGFYIVKLYYMDMGNNLTLFTQIEDGETTHCDIFNMAKNTLRINWKRMLESYRIITGQAENNFIYLVAEDSIYALKSADGQKIWGVENTISKSGSNAFDTLNLYSDKVELISGKMKNNKEKNRGVLEIDKSTGNVLITN